ncbi:FYVE, RhoGEF and PH domain-containing protein 6-like isoform X3 [Tachypleus tridentatus]|uniref:FYVE, RhoGEF and PH domain-containing protein 6-like isoform X3 n=1 Tax=Tachypleus tridentatus TaxID=6853 RepID=UPI003FD02850
MLSQGPAVRSIQLPQKTIRSTVFHNGPLVFRRVVEEAGKERGMSLIPEVSLNEILKYFPQLQNLNEKLLRELEERIEHWPENGRICDIFVTLGPFLKLFTSYFRDLDYTTTLIDVCRIKYPVFDYVVKEFEMSPCCQNLSLYNYMLKPVQRISQYCLLLQEYLNHLQDNSSDYEDTVAALQIMSQVASETIKHEDNISKLISIQNSLCGHHEVIRPGRMFIKEGDLMKLSRKIMKLRRFILFNDSLWYMKQVQYNLYRVKQEFPLVGMKVSIPIQQDYENEFNIISMTKSFILCASSPEERSEWINVLNKAIEENACKHSPIINAKKVVCSACSANGAPLSYLGLKTARVCDECFPKLHKEDSQSKCRYSSKGGDSGSRELESDLPLTSEISDELEQSGCITKKNVPSCLQEICDSDQVTSISGHLWKRGRRGWKQYWFVIDDKVLYMYKTNELWEHGGWCGQLVLSLIALS